jgi:flagellar biosynthetic protein FlhB
MAESRDEQERSEEPTPKRLEDAIKRGDVAKSQEVNTWFLLAGATLALFAFGGVAAGQLAQSLAGLLAGAHAIGVDGPALTRLSSQLMLDAFLAVGPPLARALHASVDIGEEIPPEHYKAVAEVIGYVLKLRRVRA